MPVRQIDERRNRIAETVRQVVQAVIITVFVKQQEARKTVYVLRIVLEGQMSDHEVRQREGQQRDQLQHEALRTDRQPTDAVLKEIRLMDQALPDQQRHEAQQHEVRLPDPQPQVLPLREELLPVLQPHEVLPGQRQPDLVLQEAVPRALRQHEVIDDEHHMEEGKI